MSNVLDEKLQQNVLFYNTDIIYRKIKSDLNLAPEIGSIIPFNNRGKNENLDAGEAQLLSTAQAQIFAGYSAPTEESAVELFADPEKNNFFIESGYHIEHKFIIFINNLPYIFDIDEINRKVNPIGKDPKFFIHKIEIINKAKDAFTIKSNFQIVLHVAFNYFEDLTESLIEVKPLQNGLEAAKIPLLKLIYPLYQSGDFASSLSNKQKEIKTGYGLILNQIFHMDSKEYFEKTKEGLDTNIIEKNYHLTYFKHDFEVFKSNKSVLVPFENELKINYISYESEIQNTTTNSDPKTDKIVDNYNENLYKLIFNEFTRYNPSFNIVVTSTNTVSQQFFGALKKYTEAITDLEKYITCVELGKALPKDFLKNPALIRVGRELETSGSVTNVDRIKTARKVIEQLKNQVTQLKINLSTYLAKRIMDNLQHYKITVKKSEITDYKEADDFEEFIKIFSDGFTSSAIAGGIAGSFLGGPVGAGIGTAAAIIGNTGYSAYKATTTSGDVYFKNISTLRESFRNKKIQKTKSPSQNLAFPGLSAPPDISKQTDDDIRKSLVISGGQVDAIKNSFESLSNQTVDDNTIEDDFDLKFVFFGDLLNIIPLDSTARIILGGKNFFQNFQGEQVFVNYYYTPISLASLANFLKQKIIDNPNYYYSSETFIRDIVDNLLKNAIISSGIVNEFFKDVVPTSLNTNVFCVPITKNVQLESITDIVSKLDMTSLENIKKAKSSFIKELIIKKTDPDIIKFKKYYVIAAQEEYKYYNYFSQFKVYLEKIAEAPYNKPTQESFQRFINKLIYAPCINIKSIDEKGSILKTKNLNFKRIDNQNLQTGVFLDGGGIFRYPYEFSADFKAYTSFFLDIGSLIFVTPPERRNGTIGLVNTFGYAGLYILKDYHFEYVFQSGNNNGISFPNENSRLMLGGYMVSYGDGVAKINAGKEEKFCEDFKPTKAP